VMRPKKTQARIEKDAPKIDNALFSQIDTRGTVRYLGFDEMGRMMTIWTKSTGYQSSGGRIPFSRLANRAG
jgi:hypothetical protein